jgi:hypothetical protein
VPLKIPFLSILRGAKHAPALGDLSHAIAVAAWKAVRDEAGAEPAFVLVHAWVDPAYSEGSLSMMTLYSRRPGEGAEGLHGPGTRAVIDAVEAQRAHLQAAGQAVWASLTQRIEPGRFETDLGYEPSPAVSLGTWDIGQWLRRTHFGQTD